MSEYNDLITAIFRGHPIRRTYRDGEPWFVANDICAALGYSNPWDAIRKHVEDIDKGLAIRDTLGGRQELTVVNESGLYCLILRSKKDEAREFARWVTHELIPAARKGLVLTMAAIEERLNLIHDRRKRGRLTPDDGLFLMDQWFTEHRNDIWGIGPARPDVKWLARIIYEPEPYIAVPAPVVPLTVFGRTNFISKHLTAFSDAWHADGALRPKMPFIQSPHHHVLISGVRPDACFCFTASRMTVYNQKASEPAQLGR